MRNRHTCKELREKFLCITCEFISVCCIYLKLHEKSQQTHLHMPLRKGFPTKIGCKFAKVSISMQSLSEVYVLDMIEGTQRQKGHTYVKRSASFPQNDLVQPYIYVDRHMKEQHGDCTFEEGCGKRSPKKDCFIRHEFSHSYLEKSSMRQVPSSLLALISFVSKIDTRISFIWVENLLKGPRLHLHVL